ncbi:hypothetical protein chiPu_0001503 [Chiloscyllium punctatum]|uniref:Uncharacterized protein n=1 Tax=Chiloscyllium punctatum TaxID=137246 RepID=A0A401RYB9_CHIPU|nr:hypothetical protein [Chiloscyllium punctatum]
MYSRTTGLQSEGKSWQEAGRVREHSPGGRGEDNPSQQERERERKSVCVSPGPLQTHTHRYSQRAAIGAWRPSKDLSIHPHVDLLLIVPEQHVMGV